MILEQTPKQTTEWRQANLANQTFEKIDGATIRPAGSYPFEILRCPYTKRWSGGGVINFQPS